jgi:maleylacetoacetate isomerase
MSDFALYNYFRSSTSYRIRIALNLKQINYSYLPVHLLKEGGEQFKSDYRKLNPASGVPTLKHGDAVISQTMAIVEYLDQIQPDRLLIPKEALPAAKVRRFCETINADIHSYGNLRTLAYLEKNLGVSEEQRTAWVAHWFGLGLKSLEEMLSEHAGTCCFGNQITAADTFLIPVLFTAERFKVDLSRYPLAQKINETCLKLPEFAKAHPYRQPDTPSELRIP